MKLCNPPVKHTPLSLYQKSFKALNGRAVPAFQSSSRIQGTKSTNLLKDFPVPINPIRLSNFFPKRKSANLLRSKSKSSRTKLKILDELPPPFLLPQALPSKSARKTSQRLYKTLYRDEPMLNHESSLDLFIESPKRHNDRSEDN